MSEDQKKVNLHDVEPLRPVDDEPPAEEPIEQADRIGLTTAEMAESAPAVGVSAEKPEEPPAAADEDPLEKLRRG